MATSSVSTKAPVTSTAAEIAAANRSAAQKLISSLSAGSGVDVAALAQNLVDAERTPRENEINSKITKNEAKISGYSAIMFMFNELKTKLSDLKDRNNFNALNIANSNTSAFSVTAGALATTGPHEVEVTRLARAQRTVSNGLASATTSLNGGQGLTLSLGINPSAITPGVSTTQGSTAAVETTVLDFGPLQAGQEVTVGGLTYKATANHTAAQVASVFAGVAAGSTPANPADGLFTGSLTGFLSGPLNGTKVSFKSAMGAVNVPDLTFSSTASISVPTATSVTQGAPNVTESNIVAFKDMVVGQSVTVNGLTLTATSAMTATQVAAAYANAADGSTPSNPAGGAFTGALSGFTTGVSNGANLTFTSSTADTNVTDLTVSAATKKISLNPGKDTPDDIVAAINASGTNLRAQLVNTGDGSANPFQVVITGGSGASNAFSLDIDYGAGGGSPGLIFGNGNAGNQTAVDALLKVDGITYTRSSNSISDAVQGLTFDLKATTNTAASISLTRDTTAIKEKMNALVTAYKDANDILNEVSNPKSTLETYGKTLIGDSTVRSLKQQLRSMFSGTSSTPGIKVGSLSQMGFKIDEKGLMTLDEAKLDTALADNFDDVMKSFTGGYNNLGSFSTLPAGIAGDAVRKLTKITSNTGVLTTQTNVVDKQNTTYASQLTQLKERMDRLLQRYTKQFGVMDSFVGQTNSQKTSLKSTFDGMMSIYTNKG